MKKKNGFTLIELLAVIVILAIIALIATPIVLNLINQARKGAAARSAEGIRKGAQTYYYASLVKNPDADVAGTYTFTDATGDNNINETNNLFNIDGKMPSAGTVTIAADGKVTGTGLIIDGFSCRFEDTGSATCEKSNTPRVSISSPSSSSVAMGSTLTLTATKENTDDAITWTSSNTSVATVTNGVVTPVAAGTTTITAAAGGASDTITITVTASYAAYAVGDSINYNPVTGTMNCENPVSTTGTKEGCMKWYVISASGANDSTVDVILDHNTTATVAWVTKADYNDDTEWDANTSRNSKGPITANAQLGADTTGWTNGLSPRLITADEIAHIVGADSESTIKWSSSKEYGNDDTTTKSAWFYLDGSGTTYSTSDGWQKQVANSSTPSNYAWLFDYTKECESYGCNIADSSAFGYWTSTPVSGRSYRAWYVSDQGTLRSIDVDNDSSFGVRPVITISKSSISS